MDNEPRSTMNSPTSPTQGPRHIVVGVDYSPGSARAAQLALEMARSTGGKVHLLHAWLAPYAPADETAERSAVPHAGHPDLLEMLRRSARESMDRFVTTLEPTGVTLTTSVESGDPRTVLLHQAQTQGFDLVVVGKRRLSPVAEWFLGGVATYVVRHCQVPVLVVPSDWTA